MKQNLQDVARFPEFVASVGGDEIVMHPTIYQSQYAIEQLGVSRKQLLEAIAEARANAEPLGIPFHFWDLDSMTFLKSVEYGRKREEAENASPQVQSIESQNKNLSSNGKPSKQQKRYFCFFLWRNAMIQGKGELFPCCYMSNIKVGRVENGNLRDMRGHPILADLRRDLFEGRPPEPCSSCPQMQPYDRWHIFKSGIKEVRNLIRSL
jgi:MoaA/NifB/PqqE/SkfB family radical SAM enzyme